MELARVQGAERAGAPTIPSARIHHPRYGVVLVVVMTAVLVQQVSILRFRPRSALAPAEISVVNGRSSLTTVAETQQMCCATLDDKKMWLSAGDQLTRSEEPFEHGWFAPGGKAGLFSGVTTQKSRHDTIFQSIKPQAAQGPIFPLSSYPKWRLTSLLKRREQWPTERALGSPCVSLPLPFS